MSPAGLFIVAGGVALHICEILQQCATPGCHSHLTLRIGCAIGVLHLCHRVRNDFVQISIARLPVFSELITQALESLVGSKC
jgi:hypothetical protein